jgi:hypothetical protein
MRYDQRRHARGLFSLSLLLPCCVLAGCVSAGWDSETSTVNVPGTTTTVRDPHTGTVTVTKTDPQVSSTRRRANYSDTRGAGQAASGVLDQFGGVDGILAALGVKGVVGLTGGAGLLSLVVGHLLGQNKGYTQAQVEHAGLAPAPAPKGAAS